MESAKTKAEDYTFDLLDSHLNRTPPIWFSKRLLVAILLFLGYFFYAMCGFVLNIAIVDMISNKTIVIGNQTIIETPEFNWNMEKIGMVTNAFWYGFIFSFFGGHLSQKFGGSRTLGISIMLMGAVTMLQPVCARFNFYVFLVAQALQGLFGSFFLASTAEIYAKWIPIGERTTFTFHIMNGIYIGSAVTFPLCGFLAYKWGWSMPMYMTGTTTFVWSIIWLILVKNSPSEDEKIAPDELAYILKGTPQTSKRTTATLPYTDIFKSMPAWAVSVNKFAISWGSIFSIDYLPLYMEDATHRNVDEVGLISGIPSVVIIFALPIAGNILNCIQKNGNSISQTHKLMIFGNFILAGVSFIIIVCVDHFVLSVVCFIIIRFTLSYTRILTDMVIVNMAPNHSSLLSGLSIIWFTIGALLAQNVIGFIVKNRVLNEWNVCFIISTGILLLSGLFFMVFGSSKPQPWSTSKAINQSDNEHVQNIEHSK